MHVCMYVLNNQPLKSGKSISWSSLINVDEQSGGSNMQDGLRKVHITERYALRSFSRNTRVLSHAVQV